MAAPNSGIRADVFSPLGPFNSMLCATRNCSTISRTCSMVDIAGVSVPFVPLQLLITLADDLPSSRWGRTRRSG
eukprot:12096209-Heterocapsa_arctica.AAC.1